MMEGKNRKSKQITARLNEAQGHGRVFRNSVYSEHRFLEEPNTVVVGFLSPRFWRVFGTGTREGVRTSGRIFCKHSNGGAGELDLSRSTFPRLGLALLLIRDGGLDRFRAGGNGLKLWLGGGWSNGCANCRRGGSGGAVLDHGLVFDFRLIPRTMVHEKKTNQAYHGDHRGDDYRGEP